MAKYSYVVKGTITTIDEGGDPIEPNIEIDAEEMSETLASEINDINTSMLDDDGDEVWLSIDIDEITVDTLESETT